MSDPLREAAGDTQTHEALSQAILAACVEEPPELEAGLSALAENAADGERDPADEERLTQRRRALADAQGPRHSRFALAVCVLLLAAGLVQGYASLIVRSGWLLVGAAAALVVAGVGWRKAHWMQFNLRTALGGMVLVSLPTAWVGSVVRQYWREEAAMRSLAAEWSGTCHRTCDHLPAWFHERCPPEWLPMFGHVDQVTIRHGAFGDEQMPILTSFSSLEIVDLSNTRVTNAGMEHLASQRGLRTLYLRGTRISRGVFDVFDRLPGLTQVDVLATAVTRDDARQFAKRRPEIRVAARRDDEVEQRRPPATGVPAELSIDFVPDVARPKEKGPSISDRAGLQIDPADPAEEEGM